MPLQRLHNLDVRTRVLTVTETDLVGCAILFCDGNLPQAPASFGIRPPLQWLGHESVVGHLFYLVVLIRVSLRGMCFKLRGQMLWV